jgi:hypothetical protein
MSLFNSLFSKPTPEQDSKALFHYLSLLNHFIQVKEHIYTNPKGERFILTKFGFTPVEQYNLKWQVEEQRLKIAKLEQTNRIQDLKIDELQVDLKISKTRVIELLKQNQDITKDKIEFGNLTYKHKFEKSKKGNRSLNVTLKETQKQLREAKHENATIKDNIAKIIMDAIKLATKNS